MCCAPSDIWREEAIWPQWQQWLCRSHQPPGPGAAKSFPSRNPHRGPGTCLYPFPGNGLWVWSRCWAIATTALFSLRSSETLLSSRIGLWQAPRNVFGWFLLYSLYIDSDKGNHRSRAVKVLRYHRDQYLILQMRLIWWRVLPKAHNWLEIALGPVLGPPNCQASDSKLQPRENPRSIVEVHIYISLVKLSLT